MYISANTSLEEFGKLFTGSTETELVREKYFASLHLSDGIKKELDSQQRHLDIVEEQLYFARELVKEMKSIIKGSTSRYKETKELMQAMALAIEESSLEL